MAARLKNHTKALWMVFGLCCVGVVAGVVMVFFV